MDPIGSARQKGVKGRFKIFAKKKGQYYVENPETNKRSWLKISEFYDMAMLTGVRAKYTHKKRLEWSHPRIKKFVKLYLIDKKKQTDIADAMGLLITQIHGAVKRYKKGDFDDEVREVFRDEESKKKPPITPPEPIPPPPEPTPPPPEPEPTPPPDDSLLPDGEEDEYSPEGNVDPSGVGNDPACKTVFTLISSPDETPPGANLDRMKRRMAYNAVKEGSNDPYTMFNLGKQVFEDVTPQDYMPKDYMLFSGEYLFKFDKVRFPIPIPAPNSILLTGLSCIESWSHNAIGISIIKDEVENWYAVLDDAKDAEKVVTLKWRVACPVLAKNYWSDIHDFPDTKLPEKGWNKNALAPDIEPLADGLIKHLDLSGGLKTVIERLGKHCAKFSCADIPDGDMVEQSFKNQVGACRHRALDFMIVALRLGVNVRYAVSDCHAYPEIYNSKRKIWVALDLGGCDPGGPRNPDDLNPPKPKKPETPEERVPDMPERPEDVKKEPDLRDIMLKAGMVDTDIRLAYQSWKKAGGN